MADRLSALDASFVYLEDQTTPMHVGEVAIFRRPRTGLDYQRLVDLIQQRLFLVPRYRQRVIHVFGKLARPVWADDPHFDVTYHVRRSALPKPGSDEQLFELVARLMSRPLDHDRPLWEVYFVEGLTGNRVAIITKTHQAMVDGAGAIEIGQVILDVSATLPELTGQPWTPQPEPSPLQLATDAVLELAKRPGELVEDVKTAVSDIPATMQYLANALGGFLSAARTAARPAPLSPLNVRISHQRRYAVTRTALEDYRTVRKAHGVTVNDAVLTVISGALRNWLLSRGEAISSRNTIRAMVPLSVRDADGGDTQSGPVRAYLIDLPIGEPNPVVRLHQISHAMRQHQDSGQSVAASALVHIGGFAPPTLHSLGVRAANSFSRRLFNVVVTNVPGPQVPLYAAGAKLLEVFPVVPLAKNQALSIGVTSYHGGVYFGLNADRDAMSDVDIMAAMVGESLTELVGTVTE